MEAGRPLTGSTRAQPHREDFAARLLVVLHLDGTAVPLRDAGRRLDDMVVVVGGEAEMGIRIRTVPDRTRGLDRRGRGLCLRDRARGRRRRDVEEEGGTVREEVGGGEGARAIAATAAIAIGAGAEGDTGGGGAESEDESSDVICSAQKGTHPRLEDVPSLQPKSKAQGVWRG